MKLVSLNVEGSAHIDRVTAFLDKEQPDVICLQESQDDIREHLQSEGYTTYFLPMILRKEHDGRVDKEGLTLASRHPFTAESFYYYQPQDQQLHEFEKSKWRDTCAHGMIAAKVTFEGKKYTIATTHFTWTPDGSVPNDEQKEDMHTFTELVRTLPAHVICGDFNIPREHNPLYAELTKLYTDNVPHDYNSSLDKTLHKLGTHPDKEIIFTNYMVDYVFTQAPYKAADVRLEFGISDHAAVVATIQQ